uniref:Putative secreted protein n=1 Tax=Ixodes ricinus TaxID=34613 RepID=A0A6B0UG12_IXORI
MQPWKGIPAQRTWCLHLLEIAVLTAAGLPATIPRTWSAWRQRRRCPSPPVLRRDWALCWRPSWRGRPVPTRPAWPARRSTARTSPATRATAPRTGATTALLRRL